MLRKWLSYRFAETPLSQQRARWRSLVVESLEHRLAPAVFVPENTTVVTTVVSEIVVGNSLSYAIVPVGSGGAADAAKFQIDSSGALAFLAAPNYELPTDANKDNVYQVTVEVTDGSSTDIQSIDVAVTPVDEFAPTISIPGSGTLDPTFGLAGVTTTGLIAAASTNNDFAYATALQSDGKIVAVGAVESRQSVVIRTTANGALDASFAGTGMALAEMTIARAVAIQGDGKIVVAGYAVNSSANRDDFAITRFNIDGTLDTAFGVHGHVTTDFGLLDDLAYSVALDTSGRIVVGGTARIGATDDFALARYTADGNLDPTFGINGKVTAAIGASTDQINSLAIDGAGNIVAAGFASNGSNNDFALARFTPNGALDATFNGNGKIITPVGSANDQIDGVAIDGNGKIVAAGFARIGSSDDFALARYNADGSLDPTFDTDGKVTTPFGTSTDQANDVALDANGKIVVAGIVFNGSNNDFAVARYNADGSLDASFDGDGKLTAAFGTGADQAYAVAFDGSGKVVVAGIGATPAGNGFALARFNADGTLDATFGIAGKMVAAFSLALDSASSVVIDAGGRVLVAGSSADSLGHNSDFALARFHSDGTLDTTFGSFGRVTTNFGASEDFAYNMALDGSGKIVVAGSTNNSSTTAFAVARYNADGSLDSTFGSGGKVTTAFASTNNVAKSVAIDGSGRIVVVGYAYPGSNADFALARYNPDGNLDSSFGLGGKVTTAFGAFNDSINSIVLDASGRIVVAGAANNGSNDDLAVARYNVDGSLDSTFGAGGKVIATFGSSNESANSVTIDGSGRIVVAGNNGNFALARFNADGSLDATFGAAGKVTTTVGSLGSFANSVAVDAAGRIVVAGYYSYIGFHAGLAAARYNANGSLDANFGSGGVTTSAIGSRDIANGVAIDSSGNVVVAGSSDNFSNTDIEVVRYLSTGRAFTMPENRTAVTTVSAIDVDLPAPTFTYSIVPFGSGGGADGAKFQINALGQLSFIVAPDFEDPTDAGANNVYEVTVQVSDGALSSTALLQVTVTDLTNEPQVTAIAPFVGPTSGGNTVLIIGAFFTGATAVTFDGVNAVSLTVNSATQITAVAPAHAAGIVNVQVTTSLGAGLIGASTTSAVGDDYAFAVPAVQSVVVNGGAIVARDSFNGTPALANQQSVVEQLLVTFNQSVILDPGAFNITSLAAAVSASVAVPSAASVAVNVAGVPGTGNETVGFTQYILTFAAGAGVNSFDNSVSPAAGNAFTTLKDGLYQLNTIGARVHSRGDTAADSTFRFQSLYGAVDAADITVSTSLGDGASKLLVDGVALGQMYAAFGSFTNVPGPPAYNASYDFNLDGIIDGIDLGKMYANFGTIWQF